MDFLGGDHVELSYTKIVGNCIQSAIIYTFLCICSLKTFLS